MTGVVCVCSCRWDSRDDAVERDVPGKVNWLTGNDGSRERRLALVQRQEPRSYWASERL